MAVGNTEEIFFVEERWAKGLLVIIIIISDIAISKTFTNVPVTDLCAICVMPNF